MMSYGALLIKMILNMQHIETEILLLQLIEKFNIALEPKKCILGKKHYQKKNKYTFTNVPLHPSINVDGKVMIGFSIDLTENKKSQRIIIESRELLQKYFEQYRCWNLVQGQCRNNRKQMSLLPAKC
jgi:hypothetical protein